MLVMLQSINGVFASPALTAAAWGFAASFVFCVALVLTKSWHGALSMDHVHGVQKFHTSPTPRIGGIPIVLALIVAWGKAPDDVKALLTPILFAGMPAFLFGVAEDITKRVGVTQRLLATMASGVLAWWITDYSLSRVDVWGVDWLLRYTLASVVFTAFAAGGVANSINIIDGFNGLASTMSSLAFIGFGMIAWQVGDHALTGVSIVLAACVWGFFWVNWPLGKIFLGDGGSYFVGFALAWVAILLIERNPGVSAFAPLVICAHPITEVLFSIYRRHYKEAHPGHPDRLHFHSLFKQRYVRRWCGRFSNCLRNSIAGVLVGMMTLVTVVLAGITHTSPVYSALVFLLFVFGYIAIYIRMVRHYWSMRTLIFLGKSCSNNTNLK
jgi:UDP-N-acetylmuramyl pentapeptide phosphotransferase/UDP-N-acetylglucosamine-1-phosphate transferase